jgi:hypothetical protein
MSFNGYVWNSTALTNYQCARLMSGRLALEEIVEGRLRILGFLSPTPGSIQSLNRLVELAIIRCPFVGNSSLDGVAAFESSTGIELLTVSAGVKRSAALRASGFFAHIELGRRHLMAALGAAHNDSDFTIDSVTERTYLMSIA